MSPGLIAKYLMQEGRSVITSKLCQTGCSGISEDIITHRKIMKIEPFREDQEGLTCPYVFKKTMFSSPSPLDWKMKR